MLDGLGLITPYFIYIFIGVLSQRLLKIEADGQHWLDTFVFYVAVPALLFQSVRHVPPGVESLGSFLLLTTAATGLMILFGWIVGWLSRVQDHPAVFGLSSGYSNIGYMGPPLCVAALGPAAGAPAAFIFCADVLLIFTIWPLLIDPEKLNLRGVLLSLRRVVLHPFILAVLAAILFAVTDLDLPAFIDVPMTGFQDAAAPTALFSLGLTLARQDTQRPGGPLMACLVGKLFLHPALVALMFTAAGGFDPLWVKAAIIMAALPPAANVYVMARAAGISIPLSARAVLFGTAFSALTLPVVLALTSG